MTPAPVKRGRIARLAVATLFLLAIAAAPARAGAPPGFFGTVSITSLSEGDFQRMEAAGSKRLRFLMLWSGIHPNRQGGFNWGGPDAIVKAAAAHHVKLLPILIGTPRYLAGCASRNCSVRLPIHTKTQRSSWQKFLRLAVRRYGRHGSFWSNGPGQYVPYEPITDWQIWNEENNANIHASPGDYARLLELSHEAIGKVDSRAKLVLGGLAGNVSPGHPHPSAPNFLAGVYRHAHRSWFDDVALHPYATAVKQVGKEIKHVRAVMRRHHEGGQKLLVTEIGWGSGAPSEHHQFVLTPKGQKQRLKQSFRLLVKHRRQWHLGGVYWFEWRDPAPGTGLCGFCYSAGLLKHDGKAKPAFTAFKHFTGR